MPFDLEHVKQVVQRVAESSGLELVEVDMRGGGKARMLRIVIDKAAGVTHEDCASVSREVGTILDVEDAVPGSYTLEVSSPGLDRRLEKAADFTRFTGSLVKLMTREPVHNNRHFEGRLEAFDGSRLTLNLSAVRLSKNKRKKMGEAAAHDKIEIELGNVERANLMAEL